MVFKSKVTIKQKLTNHIFLDGKKNISEKILLKSFKELQKFSIKNSAQLIQLALFHSFPILRMNKFSQKKKRRQKAKEVPSFIQSEENRISRAIKFILLSCKKSKTNKFYLHFKDEMFLNSQFKSTATEIKNDIQKDAIKRKNIFKYYSKN